jgi:XTP/dITP diphosphohydrolase
VSAGPGPAGAPGPEPVVLASANPKKAAEIEAILGDAVHLVPRPTSVPEVVEDADTFEGNARLKAQALVAATGLAALADDSGLEVEALGDAPGVHSARFAGPHATDADNVARLLADLGALDPAGDPLGRRARFRCVLVLLRPDGSEVVAQGEVAGVIAPHPRGSGGFGYDPVFVPDEGGGATFAELTPEAKHRISHRGRALAALVTALG